MTDRNNATQGTSLIIGPARASYLNALEPKTAPGSTKAKYSVCLLIPKTDKDQKKKIDAAVNAAITLGIDKLRAWGGKKPAKFKMPVRDGDAPEEEPEKHPERKGHWFLNATSDQKPAWVDAKRTPMMNPTAEEIYSGMYIRASVNFYGFANQSNGVACGLNNLQKLRDGEKFSSRPDINEDFNDDFVFEDADTDTDNNDDLG